MTEDITLFAKWELIPPPPTYTVTFNSQGGSAVAPVTGVAGGETVTAPAVPTRDGYTFEGWFTDASHATEWDFAAATVTEDITLFAKWELIPPPPTYTVTFDSQGGSAVVPVTGVAGGETISGPTAPTRNGYTFEGWFTDAGYATEWDFAADTVTEDITLFAKWAKVVESGNGGGGFYFPPVNQNVISNNGLITLSPHQSGEVSLENVITISIPKNASDQTLHLTIEKVLDTNHLITENEILISPVYEITKNFSKDFSKPITITFPFDPLILTEGQRAAIFYYDEESTIWVEVGGDIVTADKISVEVDHLTKYAILSVNLGTEETVAFSDISGHWAEATIEQAVLEGIVTGYQDNTFQPNRTVTRVEFAAMLINALKPLATGTDLTFTDEESIPEWAREAVSQAVGAGIINGFPDNSFRPDVSISRAEMAVMIARALKLPVEANVATGFADDQSNPNGQKGQQQR